MIYLSIVIPIRNEENFIINTLTMLINQDYPKDRFELLVVDGMSTDLTRQLVKSFIEEHSDINISLLDNPGRLSSCARNIGSRMAKGQLIGIIDGHVYIPHNRLFAAMERIKESENAVCLSRPQPLDLPGLNRGKSYWIALARKSWIGHSRNSFIFSDYRGFIDPTSSGFAYDRTVFEKIGYYDESFDAAEDVEFNYRVKCAGFLAYTDPDLLVYYYPRESFSALFKQQVRYGAGRAKFVMKHPESFTKETIIPPLIFLLFTLLPLAFLSLMKFPIICIFYFAIFLLYCMIVVITGFFEAITVKRFVAGFLVALGIWITHMGLGWGFIKTFLLPKYVQK